MLITFKNISFLLFSVVTFSSMGVQAADIPMRGPISFEAFDKDGDNDLVIHFRTQETGIACGDTEATLTGETFTGEMILGSDMILTVGKNCH